MTFAPKTKSAATVVLAALAITLTLSGCGTPGAPQPPSLDLPERVSDLTAIRAGQTVTLRWTTPRKTTDHLLIQKQIPATICRLQSADACQPVGKLLLDPGAESSFTDTLPQAFVTGSPRIATYSVDLSNRSGRTAGPSNPAVILAGAAPSTIEGLTAEVRADGVALRWLSGETTLVRIHRRSLTPNTPAEKPKASPLSNPAEPVFRDLLVDAPASPPGSGAKPGALDTTAQFGESYEYTAQRILRIPLNKETLELASEPTPPVHVDVVDTFPPAVPQGLAAVSAPEDNTIDLSWQPDSEEDLRGYIVYRATAGETLVWQRISGVQPLPSPTYRDASIAPGVAYLYAVSAIDQTGHESERSAPAQESAPNP